MTTDPTEETSLRPVLLVMAGLPTRGNTTANVGQSEVKQYSKAILEPFCEYMRIENYSQETITRYAKMLQTLATRGTNLYDFESIKKAIANQKWSNGTKQNANNACTLFLTFNKIKLDAKLPYYSREDKIVFIPLEAELDQLIAGSKHRLATFLQTLKETGARYGEIALLKWTDYNTESQTLAINNPEKRSNPRAPKISAKLATMLAMLPHDTKTIFDYKDKETIRRNYQRARKRIAKNLGNPRIMQIHFHTFRHWKATTLLHQTNNVWTVMKLLGHKNLNNTQRYIGLLPDLTDDYVTEESNDIKTDAKLLQNGYEYITERNGTKLYKKRK